MSSDYLENIIDNEKNIILLTMKASGFAQLTIMDDDKDGEIEGNIVSFNLTPDESGWNNAANIASALEAWIDHTKRIKK